MQFLVLLDRDVDTYNNLSLFLDIGFHFNFVAPSLVMLKLVMLASTMLPTGESL